MNALRSFGMQEVLILLPFFVVSAVIQPVSVAAVIEMLGVK